MFNGFRGSGYAERYEDGSRGFDSSEEEEDDEGGGANVEIGKEGSFISGRVGIL